MTKEDKALHTPGPWSVGPMPHQIMQVNTDKTPLWRIASVNRKFPNHAANAALIVRAVNSHAELLSALEALWEWVWEDNRGDALYPEEQVRAAVSKAKGQV